MISSLSFKKENIENIKKKYPKLDIQLIERTIFAFGLLEALVKVKLPFIFKGGTSLMLLLDNPYRLSTDIDIVVAPNIEIENYLDEVAKIYPFIRREEQIRKGRNNIIKKHYKYYYQSPTRDIELPILLDILFEENSYEKIIEKEIKSEFLITKDKKTKVNIPSIESILGDKLTAFAPNTTGIQFEYTNKEGKRVERTLEVMKQFLDCSVLIKEAKNFNEIIKTYDRIVQIEINYRGIDASREECLMDTFNSALAIFTRGNIDSNQYRYFLNGIKKIQNHVYGFDINGELAYQHAARIMLISARLIKRKEEFEYNEQKTFENKNYKSVNQIRKIDKETFNIAAAAIRLLKLEK